MPKGRMLDPNRQTKQRLRASKRQEGATAERVDGKTTPGSGSQWHSKGDVVTKYWLIENKTTVTSEYGLKVSTLRKVVAEAALEGKTPALEIEFDGRVRETFVVLPLRVAQELGYGSREV